MVMPRETVKGGAPATCPECNRTVVPEVLHSPAGYYVGTMCGCGPYSRESTYFATEPAAAQAQALASGRYGR
jgi:hypothetical protein